MAFKLYPAGATTNSDSGVTDIGKCLPTLRSMAEVRGPVTRPNVLAAACSCAVLHATHCNLHAALLARLHVFSMHAPHTIPRLSLVASCPKPAACTSIRAPHQPRRSCPALPHACPERAAHAPLAAPTATARGAGGCGLISPTCHIHTHMHPAISPVHDRRLLFQIRTLSFLPKQPSTACKPVFSLCTLPLSRPACCCWCTAR